MSTTSNASLPHEQFIVYVTPQKIFLVPNSPKDNSRLSNVPALEIDRSNSSLSANAQPALPEQGEQAYGLVGLIKLLAGNYLILITGRKLVGVIQGHKIWRITRTNILPISATGVNNLDAQQQQDEKQYKQLLQGILDMDFYYAPTYDLTNTHQRSLALDSDPANKGKPLWTRADPRFFWNKALLKNVIAQGHSSWISPVMMGFIQIESDSKINGRSFHYGLISRRNLRRAGTRFFVRGIDVEGNVANNVEAEQLAWLPDGSKITSFVETRGSIPVFWSQTPTLKYTPKISVGRFGKETELAFRRHFDEQMRYYGRHTLINLVNQHGSEGEIAAAYAQHHGLLGSPDLRYVPFDFHHHCKGMKFENLNILLNQIVGDVDSYGFCALEGASTVRQQKGTFRTNCVDNLDRTNVVQTMIARESLNRQLRYLGILSATESFESNSTFNSVFKNIWANNADAISIQYSGTGALKNDFTRTGKRDFKGVMNDGINSVTRYYLNNFKDGFRQDGFELFLGNYVVDPSHLSPFSHGDSPVAKDNTNRLIMVGLVFAMMVVTSLFAPVGSNTGHKTAVILFWLVALFVAWQLFLRYGKYWVNHPKLLKKE